MDSIIYPILSLCVVVLLDKMRLMASLNFIVSLIIFFLYTITVIPILTMELSQMLILIMSGIYLMINFFTEK